VVRSVTGEGKIYWAKHAYFRNPPHTPAIPKKVVVALAPQFAKISETSRSQCSGKFPLRGLKPFRCDADDVAVWIVRLCSQPRDLGDQIGDLDIAVHRMILPWGSSHNSGESVMGANIWFWLIYVIVGVFGLLGISPLGGDRFGTWGPFGSWLVLFILVGILGLHDFGSPIR
jgi:hypothetical protein